MADIRRLLIAAGVATSMLGASIAAIDIAAPVKTEVEGRHLVAYADSLGIATACEGTTRGIKIGMVFTNDQCDEKKAEDLAIAAAVVDKYSGVCMPNESRAAFILFVDNVGPGTKGRKDGFVRLKSGKQTAMLRKLRAGDVRGACNELKNWANAGGRACEFTKGQKNGCYGIFIRRQREQRLCLSGL